MFLLGLREMTPRQEKPVFTSLMSLSSAAAVVYKATMNHGNPSEGSLNNVARMIAERTRVFTVEDNLTDPAMLMPSEISEGTFQKGGACLEFSDGRRTISNLVISTSALPKLVPEISALYKSSP